MFYLLPGLWAVFCSLVVVSPLGGLFSDLGYGYVPGLFRSWWCICAVVSLVLFVTFARVVGCFFFVLSSVSG